MAAQWRALGSNRNEEGRRSWCCAYGRRRRLARALDCSEEQWRRLGKEGGAAGVRATGRCCPVGRTMTGASRRATGFQAEGASSHDVQAESSARRKGRRRQIWTFGERG